MQVTGTKEKRYQVGRSLGVKHTLAPILAPYHTEAVWPWVSHSTSPSLSDSREPLQHSELMPALQGIMIYEKCWVRCLAHGRYSRNECRRLHDAQESESPLCGSETSRRHSQRGSVRPEAFRKEAFSKFLVQITAAPPPQATPSSRIGQNLQELWECLQQWLALAPKSENGQLGF